MTITFKKTCALESGLKRASSITRKWLTRHKTFNAAYDGKHLILSAVNDPEDRLITSQVLTIEHAGTWTRFVTNNSTINICEI